MYSSKVDLSTVSKTGDETWSFTSRKVNTVEHVPSSPWHLIWNSSWLVDAADLQHSSKHSRQYVCLHEVLMGLSASQKQIGQSPSTLVGSPEREGIGTACLPSIIARAVSYCCCVPLIVIFLHTTLKMATFLPMLVQCS